MEDVLEDIMYQTPSDHTIVSVKITREAVLKQGDPIVDYDPKRKPKPLKLTVAPRKRNTRPARAKPA
jgi:ATP-dependent Clp protease ATP-binding subunit ClpX